MKTEKKLGIYMDHQEAHLIEFAGHSETATTIESKFTHQEKEQTLHKSEKIMHNKEQHEQAEYYKQLGQVIRNYDEVVLFGPTEAKSQLHNTIKNDHLFENIKIEVEQADKMSEAKQHEFVQHFFANSGKHK